MAPENLRPPPDLQSDDGQKRTRVRRAVGKIAPAAEQSKQAETALAAAMKRALENRERE